MNIKNIAIPQQGQATLTGNKLRIRYIVALSIIAILTISSQFFIQQAFYSLEDDSRIINIAGRQRMLSQKIAKTSYRLMTEQNSSVVASLRLELTETLMEWRQSHQYLQKGDFAQGLPGNNSTEIIALFAEISTSHQAIITAVESILSANNDSSVKSETIAIISDHEERFLDGMNRIVFRYDLEASERVNFTKLFELVLVAVILLVLALEALFIFAPAVRQITHDMLELIKREEDLDTFFEVSPTVKLLVDPMGYSIIRANQRAYDALRLVNNDAEQFKLSDFIDSQYHENRTFFQKLINADAVDEYEIVILCAEKCTFPMLASVRKISLRGQEVIVVGMTDISEIKKAQEVLERHATIDELTGLLNRRTGMMLLDKLMAQSRRTNKELSLCFMDIDGLKKTNDDYGHKSGDWLIATVCHVTTEFLRKSDIVARIGGDEFIIIFPECDSQSADNKMVAIQKHLSEITTLENKPFPIEFSFGVVNYNPTSTLTAENLLEQADQQMYRNKNIKKSALQHSG